MWQYAAMAGFNILVGSGQAEIQQKQAKMQYEYQRGQEMNAGIIRASQNIQRMTQANAARAQQWRDNNKKLDAMGSAYGQNAYNFALQKDSVAGQRFESQIQAAGALGSITAQAAASGVGGASVEQLAMTEELRQQRTDATFEKTQGQLDYAQRMNAASILDRGYNSLDMSTIYSDLDMTPQGLVLDTSQMYNYSIGKMALDGINGMHGNMNNLGINLQQFGFEGPDWFGSTGKDNQGLGGGAGKKGSGALYL